MRGIARRCDVFQIMVSGGLLRRGQDYGSFSVALDSLFTPWRLPFARCIRPSGRELVD